MVSLDISLNARQDILNIRNSNPRAAAIIVTFLQELKTDSDWLNKLLMYGDNQIGVQGFNAKQWEALKRTTNLWRLKLLNCPVATNYRIIYGYHWQFRQVVIYAVVERENFNYDTTCDISRRIITDWNAN